MSDLLSEIKEDIAKDRLNNIWQKGKYYIVALALSIILFTIIFNWHQSKQIAEQKIIGNEYYKIVFQHNSKLTIDEQIQIYVYNTLVNEFPDDKMNLKF